MDGGEALTFTYNKDGVRTSKGNIKYILDGSTVIGEEHDDYNITYLLDENGSYIGFIEHTIVSSDKYYYVKNQQGDVVQLLNENLEVVANYSYNAWGLLLSVTDASGNAITTAGNAANINPIRYRGYYYDTETGFYYCGSRYYDPESCRWINADIPETLSADFENFAQYNLFAYCFNNPVNMSDETGTWPNWAKVVVGAVATVAAVAVTVATGGAAAPVLIGVAASTIGGAATKAISHRVNTGSWEGAGKAALDGAADGFMTGGLCALGGSLVGGAVRTIKNAKSGITIGKMGTFEDVAELARTRHYSGLKEFNAIKKVFGQKAAESVGWWQNKCVVKGVMALKGSIYDCGGALTGAYAKEVALTRGYEYLYNIWLM